MFPLLLPSFLHPSIRLYHLMVGVLSPWKEGKQDARRGAHLEAMCVSSLVILKKKKKNRILHLTVFSLSVGGDRRRLQGQFWQSGFHINRESRAEYLVPSWENCPSKRCGRAGPKMWGKMEETKSNTSHQVSHQSNVLGHLFKDNYRSLWQWHNPSCSHRGKVHCWRQCADRIAN